MRRENSRGDRQEAEEGPPEQGEEQRAAGAEREVGAAAEAAGSESSGQEGGADPDALRELEGMRDRFLRLAAEYDNFRKRTDRERSESRDRAQAQLVERLLEPLDDLQRVAQYSAEGTTVDTLLEGVRMVERKLLRVLESAGLETVEARGEQFDPSVHEALMMSPADTPDEDNTVGEVFQSGYRFRGSLLRPARVQVKKHEG
jgi:molecular chaperone GrpE